MNILFAATEGYPFLKTGGLADVVAALPKALRKEGADVRVVLPKAVNIPEVLRAAMRLKAEFEVPVGWRMKYGGLWELVHEGIVWYFIDNEQYFKRDGLYGCTDDGERFAYFSRAVLEAIRHMDGFVPDILHTHDWHTGPVGALLDKHYRHEPIYREIRSVFTIHNLQFQGIYPYEVLGDLLGLDHEHYASGQVEYYGKVNYLKAGLVFADRVTTVSPSYAEEIRTPAFGEGLDGELRYMGGRLTGIVNGIDDKSYNPAKDPALAVNYRSNLVKKGLNKAALQREYGLPERPEVPLVGIVSRITTQKGFDLITEGLYGLMEHDDLQLVVLGAGDRHYEDVLSGYAGRYPHKMAVRLGFDEAGARRIYAGADLFLMPSRFEPCGISQLIAMRYGTLPVVRETGGLKDTVQPYNVYTGEGNGFSFAQYTTHDMVMAVRRALEVYREPDRWKRLVKQALAGDYGWNGSARQYMALYGEVLSAASARKAADEAAAVTSEAAAAAADAASDSDAGSAARADIDNQEREMIAKQQAESAIME